MEPGDAKLSANFLSCGFIMKPHANQERNRLLESNFRTETQGKCGGDSLFIVMPAYNEEQNIERVIREWYPKLEGKSVQSALVVADSGSTDGTHEILLRLKKSECPKLRVLSDTGTCHGPKLMALYRYALNEGADYIFQTDSDGQTNPAEFAAFWRHRREYAAIFGKRTEREDGKERVLVEKVVCLLLRHYFKVRVPDANAPFRLMRAGALEKYLGRLPDDYHIPNIMLTVYFVRGGERVRFPGVSFKPRSGGKSSVNFIKIAGTGFRALRDFTKFRKELNCKEAAHPKTR